MAELLATVTSKGQVTVPALVRLPGLEVDNRGVMLAALDVFAESGVDFGDAMIVASMRGSSSTELYSYDADFDRFVELVRCAPM